MKLGIPNRGRPQSPPPSRQLTACGVQYNACDLTNPNCCDGLFCLDQGDTLSIPDEHLGSARATPPPLIGAFATHRENQGGTQPTFSVQMTIITSTSDWCEANFDISEKVAEPANTLSALVMVLPGLAWWLTPRATPEQRRLALALIMVGVASACFHATLSLAACRSTDNDHMAGAGGPLPAVDTHPNGPALDRLVGCGWHCRRRGSDTAPDNRVPGGVWTGMC